MKRTRTQSGLKDQDVIMLTDDTNKVGWVQVTFSGYSHLAQEISLPDEENMNGIMKYQFDSFIKRHSRVLFKIEEEIESFFDHVSAKESRLNSFTQRGQSPSPAQDVENLDNGKDNLSSLRTDLLDNATNVASNLRSKLNDSTRRVRKRFGKSHD